MVGGFTSVTPVMLYLRMLLSQTIVYPIAEEVCLHMMAVLALSITVSSGEMRKAEPPTKYIYMVAVLFH